MLVYQRVRCSYLFYIISIQLNCQETFMWGSSVSFSTATETCVAKFSFPSALGYFLRLGRQDGMNGIWLRICDEARCRWGHETTVYHIYPAFWCNCLILFAYLHSYQLVILQPSTDIYMGTSPKHGNVTRKNMQKYECIQRCLQTQRAENAKFWSASRWCCIPKNGGLRTWVGSINGYTTMVVGVASTMGTVSIDDLNCTHRLYPMIFHVIPKSHVFFHGQLLK